jgi:hypothetical protein
VIGDWERPVCGGGQAICRLLNSIFEILNSSSSKKKAPARRPAPVKPFNVVVTGYYSFLAAWSPSLMASCSFMYLPCLVFP